MKISIKQYAQALYELTLGKSEGEVKVVADKFIEGLAKNNDLKLAKKIIEKFEKIYNEENGIILVEVVTAGKIDSNDAEKIKKYLLKKYSAKEIILNNKIDKSVKGGAVIRVGDDLMDASIEGKLRDFSRALNN